MQSLFKSQCGRVVVANSFEQAQIVRVNSFDDIYACAVSGRHFIGDCVIFGEIIRPSLAFQMTDMPQLDELQRDLITFYDEEDCHELFYKVCKGDLCAVNNHREWFRGIVRSIDHQRSLIVVFLVDFGRRITVPSQNIRVITTYFASLAPFSFPCRLIALNKDELRNEATLLHKLRRICGRAKAVQLHYLTDRAPYVIRMLVNQGGPYNKRHSAYVLSPSYAVLAIEKIQCDGVEWIASNIGGRGWHNSAANKKVGVNVSAIRSPAEIYVSADIVDTVKRKIHATIQRWAADHRMLEKRDENKEWKNGDQCLVYVRRSQDIEMWYRGRIDEVHGNEMSIFLRDFGDIVHVKANDVMRTTEKLVRMSDGVIKCHLDGVNSWLPSSIDILRSMVGECGASFAPKVNDSVPITLWRPTKETTCMVILEWLNLNRWLVTATVIEVTGIYIQKTQAEFRAKAEWNDTHVKDGTSTFLEHFDLDNMSLEEDSIESTDAQCEYEEYGEGATYFRMTERNFYELNDWAEGEVVRWLPSVRTEQLIFDGTPVYIDNNCVLHIHDAYRKYLAQHLSVFITRAIGNDESDFDPFTNNWTVGQTCFAKYDDSFYRGTVQSVNRAKGICVVKFVDYGNSDPCNFEQMRPATLCGHIPILARKYCLDNVLPISDDNRWSSFAVNVLRTQILQQMCMIRVKEINRDAAIQPCSIRRFVDRVDMKSLLIELGLGYERTSVSQQRR